MATVLDKVNGRSMNVQRKEYAWHNQRMKNYPCSWSELIKRKNWIKSTRAGVSYEGPPRIGIWLILNKYNTMFPRGTTVGSYWRILSRCVIIAFCFLFLYVTDRSCTDFVTFISRYLLFYNYYKIFLKY